MSAPLDGASRRQFVIAALGLGGLGLTLLWPGRRGEAMGPAVSAAGPGPLRLYSAKEKKFIMSEKIAKTPEEWQALLTPEQYKVTRLKGTERAFTGEYWNVHDKGVYQCVCCGNDLFDADTKFESGTGWPSFWKPIAKENVETETDRSMVVPRSEVLCRRCGAHLGHVFDDGPPPTGLRYCMNSASLRLDRTK